MGIVEKQRDVADVMDHRPIESPIPCFGEHDVAGLGPIRKEQVFAITTRVVFENCQFRPEQFLPEISFVCGHRLAHRSHQCAGTRQRSEQAGTESSCGGFQQVESQALEYDADRFTGGEIRDGTIRNGADGADGSEQAHAGTAICRQHHPTGDIANSFLSSADVAPAANRADVANQFPALHQYETKRIRRRFPAIREKPLPMFAGDVGIVDVELPQKPEDLRKHFQRRFFGDDAHGYFTVAGADS